MTCVHHVCACVCVCVCVQCACVCVGGMFVLCTIDVFAFISSMFVCASIPFRMMVESRTEMAQTKPLSVLSGLRPLSEVVTSSSDLPLCKCARPIGPTSWDQYWQVRMYVVRMIMLYVPHMSRFGLETLRSQ